jgi:hypothetical protein
MTETVVHYIQLGLVAVSIFCAIMLWRASNQARKIEKEYLEAKMKRKP